MIRSVPRALGGLAMMAFVATWMIGVARGGHNNWDRGKAIPPFATHNVAIATLVGLWFLPPCLYMISGPFWTWRRLKRSSYALTDRRALVAEPGLLGRAIVRSYPAGSLGLMRLEQGPEPGDAGDLIFESPRTWVGTPRPVGFLAIDRAREVEALVREALLAGGRPATGPPDLSAARRDPETPAGRTYRVAWTFRLFQFVALAAGVLVGLCVLGDIALVLVVLVVRPGFLGAMVPGMKKVGLAGSIAAGIGTLLAGGFVTWGFFRFVLAIPDVISIGEDGTVRFRSRLRTVAVPVRDILAVRTGGWADPNRFQAVVLHRRGKIVLINQFPDFMDFLAAVKDLNPAVEIRGF